MKWNFWIQGCKIAKCLKVVQITKRYFSKVYQAFGVSADGSLSCLNSSKKGFLSAFPAFFSHFSRNVKR